MENDRRAGLFGSELSLPILSGIVGVTVVLFLLWGSPLWLSSREESHVARIALSYLAAIPLLAAALLAKRRFDWTALLTGLGIVWVSKLLITSTLFIALAHGPAAEYTPAAPWETANAERPAAAKASRGQAKAAAEVSVTISHGKYGQQSYTAAPGDRLLLGNGDTDLHTLRLSKEGRAVMNVPLPPGTGVRSVPAPGRGTYLMTCDNHSSEQATLIVADAPGGT